MKEDEYLCPQEIKILEEIYRAFQGPEWNNKEYWLDQSVNHCVWYGVTCDTETNSSTVMLELPSNGLSGNLNARISELMSGLNNLEVLNLEGNDIMGSIPTEIAMLDGLVKLDLSNQKHGLEGIIPEEISNMKYLQHLVLAGNKLGKNIPPIFGLEYLKVLDLSSNALSGSIPTEIGRLLDTVENLNLSNNKLNEFIPSELGKLPENSLVYLSGNTGLSVPAPLDLCFKHGFDLKNDPILCPSERGALKKIYDSAKGREWTKSTNW